MSEEPDWKAWYIAELSLRWAVEEWYSGRLTDAQLREQLEHHRAREDAELNPTERSSP